MIIGIGTDLVQVSRFEKVFKNFPKALPERILHVYEYDHFKGLPHHKQQRFLAKTFAAKEALLKALGTGLSQGIRWQEVVTGRHLSGCPWGRFEGTALKVLQKFLRNDTVAKIHLTLTDEADFIQAFAVISMESDHNL